MKKDKNNKKLIIGVFLFLFIAFLYFSNKLEITGTSFTIKKYNLHNEESKVVQIDNDLKEIDVRIKSNSKSSPQGNYKFNIYDKSNKLVHSENINFKEFLYSGSYTINLRKLNLEKGKYIFKVKHYNYNYDTKINNYTYNLKLKYNNTNIWKLFISFYAFVSILFLFILVRGLKNKDELHVLFLKLALPIMLLYVFAIPLYTGNDEKFQWVKIYGISELKIIPDIKYNYSGVKLPKGIELKLPYDGNLKYRDIINNFKYKINDNNISFLSGGSMDIYSPVQYMPQVLGIKIFKLFTSNIVLIIYGARLFNTIVGIILLTLAIKVIPSHKKIMFFIGLWPVLIQGFTTLSGDQLTISLSFLFIAYLMKLKSNSNKLETKDIIILSILSSLLSLCKLVYILIPFLIFILPKEKYKNQKQHILTLIFTLGIPVILNVCWLLILSGVSDGSSPFAVPSKNLKNFLHNPFVFFKYFIYSLESHGYKIITEIFNNDLLMMQLVINNTLVPTVTICTLIYLLFEKSEKKLVFSKGDKVFMILLTISLISLIYLSDYIFWDNYNTKYIYGVYGRYFIPILPIICYLISEKIKLNVNMKNSRVLLLISCLMINFMTLMEIFIKFI